MGIEEGKLLANNNVDYQLLANDIIDYQLLATTFLQALGRDPKYNNLGAVSYIIIIKVDFLYLFY